MSAWLSIFSLTLVAAGAGGGAAASRVAIAPGAVPATPVAPDCEQARGALEQFFQTLPRTCQTAADCDGAYYRVDSCEPAVVFAKPGLAKEKEPELAKFQAAVRDACKSKLAAHGPCAPKPYTPDCQRYFGCFDVESRKAEAFVHPKFTHAIMHGSCAPWDGFALAFTMTVEKQADCSKFETPYLSISWWRNLPKSAPAMLAVGKGDGTASRCARPLGCEAAKSGILVLDAYDAKKGARGHYELHFPSGADEIGTFSADWCELHELCG